MNYLVDFTHTGHRISANPNTGGSNMVTKRGYQYTTAGNKRGYSVNKEGHDAIQRAFKKAGKNWIDMSDIDTNNLQLVDVAYSYA